MKHRAFTLWELLAVVAVVAIGAAILFPIPCRSRENARRSSCQSNLKQIGLAFAQYTKDYDDKFPLLNNVPGVDRAPLVPYFNDYDIFQCPSARSHAANTTDYFVNARLAGADKTKIANPNAHVDFVILSGDGADDQASPAQLTSLPNGWRADENSPAWRHLDGANYLFIDGHVKWFRPDKITLDKPSLGKPTFLAR